MRAGRSLPKISIRQKNMTYRRFDLPKMHFMIVLRPLVRVDSYPVKPNVQVRTYVWGTKLGVELHYC